MKGSKTTTTPKFAFVGMIGNILEHYDNALFGLLAPFIAPLFFADFDPITALIMTYGIMPLGIITRPLGSLFFGWVGETFGTARALSLSLVGMAFVTAGMGFLPVYSQVGLLAPILLALLRMLQSFFMAGESVGGALYILENTPDAKRSLIGSLYDASSVGGILIASAFVAYLSALGTIEHAWRILFWAGGATALFGLYLRLSNGIKKDTAPVIPPQATHKKISNNMSSLVAISCTAGFSYITYSLAFDLMNGYIPIITSLNKAEILHVNSWLLILDMLLLPCFGLLAYKVGKEMVMTTAALILALSAIPLFWLLESATFMTVVGVRCIFVIAGTAFAAPYYAWAMQQVESRQRYTILALGASLGSQAIGKPTAALCIWLYQQTSLSWAPGLYVLVFGLAAAYCVSRPQILRKKAYN